MCLSCDFNLCGKSTSSCDLKIHGLKVHKLKQCVMFNFSTISLCKHVIKKTKLEKNSHFKELNKGPKW